MIRELSEPPSDLFDGLNNVAPRNGKSHEHVSSMQVEGRNDLHNVFGVRGMSLENIVACNKLGDFDMFPPEVLHMLEHMTEAEIISDAKTFAEWRQTMCRSGVIESVDFPHERPITSEKLKLFYDTVTSELKNYTPEND